MSRTGLLAFVCFCLSISLVASAPLPESESNLVERSEAYEYDDIFERSPALFDRELDTEDVYYVTREDFDDLESRGFFKKLGHDLGKAGKGLIKFDLKAASVASGAVAKYGGFVPGVSSAATAFSQAESKFTKAAAKRIH
ncbi:hypothetical protein GALMADRAFT_143362 [Galerina marginata CBS 339.88]|uniref:Uncharacterized protein n=1 Tax=Galerina marginata (strain CBS 339.88) TaxID=685588 RepID=A0A067SMA1_GALM3|nr:hypothetical protein GALMADRAFT_143362 [Galerina marginata CBS 339.88]